MPVWDVDECFVVVVVEATNGAEVGDVYVDGRGRGGGSGDGGKRGGGELTNMFAGLK